ncbi:HAD family hydrolase [Mycobacterium sp. URHB0044]|jgi:HAD superfamily hydrolase (TIGR01509 family)|uniref:HAD family hydrolase n=1 Tax=Mycobacterium sp. URHB0044 TaxID=1380386 RepID=UPI00048E9C63|nr:HAD family hydrolase [Mycobacterium sp. URHB0044]
MAPAPAVLFDIDGTLVDSNYLHVHAWQRAFTEVGLEIQSWRIHRCIGMDGSSLVAELASDQIDDPERVKDLHSSFYAETTGLLRPLPGARELLDAVADLGLQVVLATSAPEDELAILRKVLDRDDIVSALTSSADVDSAKPDPDIVRVALDRAGVGPERAVFVGDTVWDVEAAARAGVECLCLRSGGISQAELEYAGATAVFDDPRSLVEHLGDTRIDRLAMSKT